MAITDHFTETTNGSRPQVTSLSAQKIVGAPSISTTGLSGWPTATAVHFIMYRIDTANKKIAGSQTDWKGEVSGSTITSLQLKAGTDNVYDSDNRTVIEASPTAAWADDVVEGIAVSLKQDGTLKDAVVSSANIGDAAVTPAKWTNPYKFRASVTTATGAFTSAVWGTIPAVEEYDTNNNYLGSTYTAPVTGYYQFNASAVSTNAAGNLQGGGLRLFKNGAVSITGDAYEFDNNWSLDVGTYHLSDSFYLAAGDTVVLQCYLVVTGSVGIATAKFSGYLISQT